MKKVLSWLLLLFGAFIALSGVIDLAVGPELAEQEPGVEPGEGGPAWYGAIVIAVGIAVIALGAWISRKTQAPRAE